MIPRGIVGKLSIVIDINNSTKQLDDLLVRSKIIVAEGPGKRLDIEAEVDADQDVFLSKYVGKVISVKSGDHTIFVGKLDSYNVRPNSTAPFIVGGALNAALIVRSDGWLS